MDSGVGVIVLEHSSKNDVLGCKGSHSSACDLLVPWPLVNNSIDPFA